MLFPLIALPQSCCGHFLFIEWETPYQPKHELCPLEMETTAHTQIIATARVRALTQNSSDVILTPTDDL